MKRKKLLIGIGIGAVMVLVIGLNMYRNRQSMEIPVQVFEAKQQKIEETVLASGKVEVEEKEEITAKANAVVQDVLVNEGDLVKTGQMLISLDTTQLNQDLKREEASLALQKANLSKAKASARPQQVAQDKANLKQAEVAYLNAKNKYLRTQTLYQEGATSKEELETTYQSYIAAEAEYQRNQQRLSLTLEGDTKETIQALEAQVRQAEVAVNLARQQLADAQVKAGMDGVVLSLGVEKGKYATVGTPLVVVGNIKNLQVKADINEVDSGGLAVGQPVNITSSVLQDEEFKGEVARVGAAAITKNKNNGEQVEVPIVVNITQFNSKLKPGYTVDLKIITASKSKALVVPYEAVVEKNKRKEVWVVKKGKLEKRRVETGVGNELYITVDKGLNKGDQVVVNPTDKLKPGAAVKETPYESAKPTGKGE